MQPIYLDFAAATPLDERVLAAMQPFLTDHFYNPSSSYRAAKQVKQSLADARARVAHWIGARPAEITFTAGATESINLAIQGVMRAYPGGKILVSAIEHDAVLATARQFKHGIIAVKPDGMLDIDALKSAITDDTVLVSVGYVNNEIGTIQPLKDVAQILQQFRQLRRLRNNPLPLYLHTDASQAACYLDLHASRLGVDMLTLNGGKMYGPKQTGVLFVKTGVQLQPILFGGGQENGMRSGTENVAGAIGFVTALDIAQSERKESIVKIAAMRDELQRQIIDSLPQTVVNGSHKKRLPNNLHVSWSGVDGERLLMLLDEQGLMASTGSACAANKNTASHVLEAIGCEPSVVQGSLRLTLGRTTAPDQIRIAATRIVQAVKSTQKGL